MKKLTGIVIGAGSRGRAYTKAILSDAHKENIKIVGVAEPIDVRREDVKRMCSLPDENCYTDWKDILAQPKMADFAIIATMDYMHYEPALAAIEKGYHLLLEKPAAPSPEECAEIARAANEKGVQVIVCHVLRFTPFYTKVKEILDSGKIGRIQSVSAIEAVGNVHQSHSYVRGRWHSEKETSNMLLAKSCHDIDILQWLVGKECTKIQSFGSLTYFTRENAPEGAPARCIEGCPHADACPYNAVKLYLDDKKNNWFRSASTGTVTPTDEQVEAAMYNTDYGKCIFKCDNDVVDHQVVNMEFEDGATLNFAMNAFNRGGRYIRIFGTKGELRAYMSDSEITVYTFEEKKTEKIPVVTIGEEITSGHGGGDAGIVKALYELLTGTYKGNNVANITESVKNHLLVFAAEESRHNDTVVKVKDYMDKHGM